MISTKRKGNKFPTPANRSPSRTLCTGRTSSTSKEVIRVAKAFYKCKQAKNSDSAWVFDQRLVTNGHFTVFNIFNYRAFSWLCSRLWFIYRAVLDCRASSCPHLKKAGGERAAPMDDGPAIFLSAVSVTNKVNRCLARYSPRATTTNPPANRAPKKPAWPSPYQPKMPILGQIWSFLGKKSFFLLEKS